jgi:hypothetical protein
MKSNKLGLAICVYQRRCRVALTSRPVRGAARFQYVVSQGLNNLQPIQLAHAHRNRHGSAPRKVRQLTEEASIAQRAQVAEARNGMPDPGEKMPRGGITAIAFLLK